MRRNEASPKLVWNGAIKGMWISRSVILRRRMGAGTFGFRSLAFSLRILPGGILADAGPRWKRRVPESSPQFRRGVRRTARCNPDAEVCGSGRASPIAGARRRRGSRLSGRRDLRAAKWIVHQRRREADFRPGYLSRDRNRATIPL